MSKIHESLKANEAEILAALPKEFQEDFKKQLAATPEAEPAPLSEEAEIEAIKAELVANPDVDEVAAASELKEITPPGKAPVATEDELKSEEAALLAEVKATIR